MNEMMMSPADIRAVTEGYGGSTGTGSGFMWIFALLILLALLGGGFNGFGSRNGGSCATTEDLASGFNFSSLQGKANDILAGVNNNNQVLGNAICQLGYTNLQSFNSLERVISECCCEIKRAIDSVNYNLVQQAAGINANTTAGIQRVLDKLCEDKQERMAARIQQLELQQAMCGIVRYPMQTTYSTNCNPFFGGCGCGNGNI